MSAAVQEVILKLTADSSAFAQGTQAAKKELSVLEEAKKRIAAQDRQDAIRQQMGQLRPAAVPSLPGSSLAGLGGLARGLAGSVAVDSILAGALNSFKNTQVGMKSTSAVFGDIASEAAESIPLFGSLIKSLKQLVNESTGLPAMSRAMAQFAEISKLRGGEQGARIAGQDSLAFQSAGLGRGVGYARADAAGAQAFLAGMTPERLASYRPRPMFGFSNEASGPLQMALDQALANVGAARAGVGIAQGGVNESQALVRQRQGQVDALQKQADAAKLAADKAGRGADFLEADAGFFDAPLKRAARQRRGEQEAALRNFEGIGDQIGAAQGGLANAQNENQKRLAELQQRRNDLAQKEFDLAQARLAIERNQLELLQDKVGAMRGGAVGLAMQGPGALENLRELRRIAKESGVEALTPEQRGILAGNEITGPAFRRELEKFMRRQPGFQDLVGNEFGMGPDQLENAAVQKQDAVNKNAAQAQAEFKGQLRQIGEDAANVLIPAIKDMVDAGVREAIRKLREPMIAKQIAARQEGN